MRLGDFIMHAMPRVLERWDEFAATLQPARGEVAQEILRDHAEEILLAVVADLREESSLEQHNNSTGLSGVFPSETASRTHAVLRASKGFTIHNLIAEYRALRASVLDEWLQEHPTDSHSVGDIGRFNKAIDQAVAESVDSYTAQVERWRDLFLGMLGHDLRGPLNTIVMTVDLMARAEGTPTPVQIERLQRSGERMKELLDDLLDYSRVSIGTGFRIVRKSIDFAQVCRDELELLRAAHPTHEILLEIDGACVGAWDERRIHQMLRNLVDNAAAHGEARARIDVRVQGEGDQVTLSVTSRGPAISPEARDRMFKPLQNAAPPEMSSDQRTHLGLGLFIVQQIAAAHGGRVDHSSSGNENHFTVRMPSGRIYSDR